MPYFHPGLNVEPEPPREWASGTLSYTSVLGLVGDDGHPYLRFDGKGGMAVVPFREIYYDGLFPEPDNTINWDDWQGRFGVRVRLDPTQEVAVAPNQFFLTRCNGVARFEHVQSGRPLEIRLERNQSPAESHFYLARLYGMDDPEA